MTILQNYTHFEGRHHETGSVQNVLAYQGVRAPHNGLPLSEAMLLGVSGGISVGYFLFHYEGFDPQLALLTRNTFDPLQSLLERLGVVQTVRQTASAEKGLSNLLDTLEDGQPAIVWADMISLPYNALSLDAPYWAMLPIVVYGHDGDQAYIADRSARPLGVDAAALEAARARIKKDKYRVLSLDLPSLDKLPSAISNGIWQCIRLFTEAPPKGSKNNFGLKALEHWAAMLTNQRNPQSWGRFFAPGRPLFAALAGNDFSPGLYSWVRHFGSAGGAERSLYADFLAEAAQVIKRPGLSAAAAAWRQSAAAWEDLCRIAVLEASEPLAQAAALLDESHQLFIEQGGESTERRREIRAKFTALRAGADQTLQLDETTAKDFFARLSEQVLHIRELEAAAVEQMQAAMA